MGRPGRRAAAVASGRCAACVALGALLLAGGCGDRGVRTVVLVVVDTLRPDRLSCYGHADHETPFIDTIAGRGTLFENAHAVASWTVPSMGAMLTSRYPMQLGLVERPAPADTVFAWRDRRPQRRLTPAHDALMLAEVMADAGFHTAAFVNQPGLNVSDGFLQGVDAWYYPKTPSEIVLHDTRRSLPYEPWAPSLTAAFEIDGRLVDRFSTWIADHAGERTFAWVHLLTPHRPYNPVPAYAPRSSDPSARYDAEVRSVDELIGRLLAAIDRTVGMENALLLFTSDHGEAFGEHGMEEHGHSLHGEVVRVPLVVAGPGFAAGARISEIVRTIDIAPTILDVVDVERPVAYEGISLAWWLATGREPLPVYAEGMLYGSTERCLIDGGLKLMTDAQAPSSLYDIVADPAELHDLRGDGEGGAPDDAAQDAVPDNDTRDGSPAVAARLAARIDTLHTAHARDLEMELGARADEEEDEAATRALRSLGYIH